MKEYGTLLLGIAAIIFSLVFIYSKIYPSPSFKLVQISDFRRDQFLYDEHSGRMWKTQCYGDYENDGCMGISGWSETYVEGITNENTRIAKLAKQLEEMTVKKYLEKDKKEQDVKVKDVLKEYLEKQKNQ